MITQMAIEISFFILFFFIRFMIYLGHSFFFSVRMFCPSLYS